MTTRKPDISRWLPALLPAVLLQFLCGCSSDVTDFPPDEIRTYKHTPQGELRVHIFHPDESYTGPRPAVVFFSGGGWNNQNPSQFYPFAAHLAERGMVGLAFDYRVKNVHGTSPQECVTDGKSAVRWTRRHAVELAVDPDRIVASGGSAGGHIAVATAVLDGFDDPDEELSVSATPNALLLFNPEIDTSPACSCNARIPGDWRQMSPLHNLGPETPPTLIMQGTADQFVPMETVITYCETMSSLGAQCEVLFYEGQKHGFFNYFDGRNRYYRETVEASERFLAGLDYLPPMGRKAPR